MSEYSISVELILESGIPGSNEQLIFIDIANSPSIQVISVYMPTGSKLMH